MRSIFLSFLLFLTACGGQNEFAGGATRLSQGNAGKADEAAAASTDKEPNHQTSTSEPEESTPTNTSDPKPSTVNAKKVFGAEVEVSTLVAEPNGFSGFWVTLSVPENEIESSAFQTTLSVIESTAEEIENIFQQMLSSF